MPEYRWEPVSGSWILCSPQRALRPFDVAGPSSPDAPARCPFCQGNETETPPAVLSVRGGQPGGTSVCGGASETATVPAEERTWDVRVVPNLYPAVEVPTSGSVSASPPPTLEWLERTEPGRGYHEVVIEAPFHARRQSDISAEQFCRVVTAWQSRMQWFATQADVQYAQLFRNCGADAGASLTHLHSQLLAVTEVPTVVARELAQCRRWYERSRQCLFCELAARALQDGRRIVLVNSAVVVYCPVASRQPYEMWVQPLRHESSFELTSGVGRDALAQALHAALVALEQTVVEVPYNFWLHTSPFDTICYDHYHWHIEILPRQTKTAGFEWGTGWSINSLPPDEAAAELRRRVSRGG